MPEGLRYISQLMPPSVPTSRRLRVLHVVPDLAVGGLPRVVETLCRTTDTESFDVQVLCLNFLGQIAEQLRADRFVVHDLVRPRPGPDYFASRRVARLLRDQQIDVVHSHNTQAFIHGGLAVLSSGVSTLVHTDHARVFPDKLRYTVAERLLSTLAWRVVGVSENTTENLHRYVRIPRQKLLTIPNGIEARLFEAPVDRLAVRASLGIPSDAELLILGARLEPQKGMSFLLRAVAQLAATRPRVHLVLAGEGSLRESLGAEARALGIEARVHFVGVRLDMPALLRAAEIFVLPSLWEGLPMIVLEALAASCPIVASAVGGVPSAVKDGRTGVLVPPSDVDALARALHRLLDSPATREVLARQGRALFDEAFSAQAMTRRYEALYRRERA